MSVRFCICVCLVLIIAVDLYDTIDARARGDAAIAELNAKIEAIRAQNHAKMFEFDATALFCFAIGGLVFIF